MNHSPHSTKCACPFCDIEGKILRKSEYPAIFENNPFRKTTGPNTVGGGHRFIPGNDRRPRRRGSRERLEIGIRVLEVQNETRNFKYQEKGIRGLPAIMGVPKFHETRGHVSDTLHTLLQGILKDIIKAMMKGHGKRHNFAETQSRDFSYYDDIMATMTRVSESDRNCTSLAKFKSWTAYDYLQFILHSLALICSDEIVMDTDVYELLVHVSNIVYLSHYGRMTDLVIHQVQDEIDLFKAKAETVLKEEYYTIKFHLVTEHWCDFLRWHGSASWTDAFNMERFNLHTMNTVTALSQELRQIVRNFSLKNHSRILSKMDSFGKAAKKNLSFLGFTEEYTPVFTNVIKKLDKDHRLHEQFLPLIEDVIKDNSLVENWDSNKWGNHLKRVLVLTRKGVKFECGRHSHKKNSKVKDSYIKVDEGQFGEVEEILSLASGEGRSSKKAKFIFIVRKFRRKETINDIGTAVKYPVNQFPFEDSKHSGAPEFFTFLLRKRTFIQKAQISQSSLYQFGEKVRLFSVYPNEWFRM